MDPSTIPARHETRQFSYLELMEFTSNLAANIGSGGSAEVYSGKFSDGRKVAVKVILVKDNLFETFKAELETMRRISHQYIVKFYGFCIHTDIQALVFEYMENGSLDKILLGNDKNIEWENFYDISIKTAEGLSYLHHDCQQHIFHWDIKPANVLLDSTYSPKIGDFGLAKFVDRNKSHLTMSGFEGTCGYAAPETWNPGSEVTYKCDVYSFGMMLFDVLRKRSKRNEEEWFPTVLWKTFENGDLDRSIKDDLKIEQTNIDEAKILSMVGLWCVQYTAKIRPSMRDVVKILESRSEVERPPNPAFPNNPNETQTSTPSIQPQEEVNLPLNQRSRVEDYDAIAPPMSNLDLEESYKNTSDDANQSILRCPPGGKSAVIVYTTSLETAGKAFVKCNYVRLTLNSHQIQMFEKNVDENPIYREELILLTGKIKVPQVFVNEKWIGGSCEIMKLDQDGKLKIVFDGTQTI